VVMAGMEVDETATIPPIACGTIKIIFIPR
jgi:hypothetical protein